MDYGDIAGNEQAKRALVLAAAGRHNILIMGSAESDKKALAAAVGGILPPLTDEEARENAFLYEQAREPVADARAAPVRAVSPLSSIGTIVGGGRPVRPGEVSLANHGALVLNDLQDFDPCATSALVCVSEQGESRLVRFLETRRFPADNLLVATAAPCPCGGRGCGSCTCSAGSIRHYRDRLGGRLFGQFEIHCDVLPLSPARLLSGIGRGPSSREMRDQVSAAREFRARRIARAGGEMTEQEAIAALAPEARDMMLEHGTRLNLRGTQILRALSVARTVADVEGHEEITAGDVAEGLVYSRDVFGSSRADVPREFRPAPLEVEWIPPMDVPAPPRSVGEAVL